MTFLNKIKTLAVSTLLLSMLSACTKDFEELNTSPSLVTEDILKPDNLLSKVLKESIFQIPQLGRIESGIGRMSRQAFLLRAWITELTSLTFTGVT